MSPEQFKGGELDARSDIYSLGVMTYEMLTGRLPFDADTPWAWATQHMTAQPFPFETIPMAGQVPPKMKAAVMRALSKDKTQRQQSVREFFEDFTAGGQRLSSIGMAPRTSFPDSGGASGGTAMMPAARPAGGAQTQVGEPIFVGQQQPAGRTMMDSANPSNPGYPPAQQGYPSNPAMPAQAPVPTGGGQAYPAPMSAPTKPGGGTGVIVGGIVAVVAVIAIVILVVVLKKPGATAEDADAGVIALPGSGTAVVASDATDAGSAPGPADAGVKIVNNVPPTGTTTVKVPAIDPKADAECKSAEGLASGGNVSPAVNHFRNCDGPGKVAARVAIDQAAQRAAAKGCGGLRDAQAAASIGAATALNTLKAKHCSK
jgi:serine/threonine-protein kinase